jgi:hypothetical protein
VIQVREESLIGKELDFECWTSSAGLRVLASESESAPGFQGGKFSSVVRLSTDKQMVERSIPGLGLHPNWFLRNIRRLALDQP